MKIILLTSTMLFSIEFIICGVFGISPGMAASAIGVLACVWGSVT